MAYIERPGTVRVFVRPGATVRGTKYYAETALDVTPEYGKYLVDKGCANEISMGPAPVRAVGRVLDTLGAGRSHLFVTRAATLQFQELRGGGPFEEARRELARLLLDARPVPGDARRWSFLLCFSCACPGTAVIVRGIRRAVFHAEGCPGAASVRRVVAYVVPDGGLLLVASLSLAEDAPDAHIPGPPTAPFPDVTP